MNNSFLLDKVKKLFLPKDSNLESNIHFHVVFLPSACLSVLFLVRLSVYLCLFMCLFVYLFISASFCVYSFICLSLSLNVCLLISLSLDNLSVHGSVSIYIFVSLCLCLYLHVYLFFVYIYKHFNFKLLFLRQTFYGECLQAGAMTRMHFDRHWNVFTTNICRNIEAKLLNCVSQQKKIAHL
jgi:hypothetical protein